MEKSKILIQFFVIFRQFGDVLSFLYARRLRGYTATAVLLKLKKKQLLVLLFDKQILSPNNIRRFNEKTKSASIIKSKSTQRMLYYCRRKQALSSSFAPAITL